VLDALELLLTPDEDLAGAGPDDDREWLTLTVAS